MAASARRTVLFFLVAVAINDACIRKHGMTRIVYSVCHRGPMQANPLPSNRSFGTLFVVVFGLLGTYWWWRASAVYLWPWGLSVLTLVVTLAKPAWLTPANRGWMKLAELLNRVVSPIVLGVIFFCLFTPTAWLLRSMGRDAMKRRFEPAIPSYWVERDPPGPDPTGLPNQF